MEKQTKKKKGTYGDGCIFKRGNRYYYKNSELGISPTALKVSTLPEAKEVVERDYLSLKHLNSRNEVLFRIAENKTLAKKTYSVKIDQVWDKFRADPGRTQLSKETLELYKSHWNQFRNWLAKRHSSVSQIGQIDIAMSKEYALILKESGISQKTFNDHITHLDIIFRYVHGMTESEELWGRNTIKKARPEYVSRKEFDEAGLKKIWDVFQKKGYFLKDKAEIELVFWIAAYTGLRLKDAVLFEKAHVNLDKNLISTIPYKTRSKTQQRVFIPLHPILKGKLTKSEYWKDEKTEYIMPNVAQRYLRNKWAVNQSCLRIIKQAGYETSVNINGRTVNQYGFSSFRHSFVSFCANAGVPLPVVQAIVGHNCSSVTRYYVHISQDSMQKAIDSLPGSDKKTNSKNRLLEQIQNMSEEQIQKLLLLSRKV